MGRHRRNGGTGRVLWLVVVALVLCIGAGCQGGGGGGAGDDLRLRFAVFADNQVGWDAWQATKEVNPSSANIPQLRQNIEDIAAAAPRPDLLFILGDLVMNEVVDQGQTLRLQLNAWQQVCNGISTSQAVPLIPVPGNHELVWYSTADRKQGPNPDAVTEWVTWFRANGYGRYAGNGPGPQAPNNPDNLVRDEAYLTYSFDVSGVHFVIINTDTMSTRTRPGTTIPLILDSWIPINWVEQDIRVAQANPAVCTIIVLAHRPVESPGAPLAGNTIINTPEFPFASRLARVMRENSKVKLFVGSHMHQWEAYRLEGGAGVWQLLAGNGGAPVENNWNPNDGPNDGPYFGYSVVNIYRSGKVTVENWGRPLPPTPQKFYEDAPVPPPPAALRGTVTVYDPPR